ncbi:TetR/AcrR family transcriptional regulator [Pseudonocardiaceae bacterium YIM PH 21723]|nr:TetR/AcrR family transcriptional regulator [Pseudonocardiaceae bacterium YIM PH 21723]
MATRARERLLATADELFYTEGIRAVGVERLLEVSGVGRASFYRHFAGKEDLVLAVLRERHDQFREWIQAVVAAGGGDPLAIFDELGDRFSAAEFRGCAFINAMVEDADPGNPVHRLATEHKEWVAGYLTTLLRSAGHAGAEQLAEQFLLLIDGAHVAALRTRSAAPATQVRAIAERLLEGT